MAEPGRMTAMRRGGRYGFTRHRGSLNDRRTRRISYRCTEDAPSIVEPMERSGRCRPECGGLFLSDRPGLWAVRSASGLRRGMARPSMAGRGCAGGRNQRAAADRRTAPARGGDVREDRDRWRGQAEKTGARSPQRD
jgi:hypothetical protein